MTPRERECLRWAAQGKTFQEISMILGISFGVVRQHLDKARLRLDAVNLTHAVAIAVAAGLADDRERRLTKVGQDKRAVSRHGAAYRATPRLVRGSPAPKAQAGGGGRKGGKIARSYRRRRRRRCSLRGATAKRHVEPRRRLAKAIRVNCEARPRR